mgnify:CR=1 FL=1
MSCKSTAVPATVSLVPPDSYRDIGTLCNYSKPLLKTGRLLQRRKPGDLPECLINSKTFGIEVFEHMGYKFVVYMLLVCPLLSWAQATPAEKLDTVYLVDRQLKVFNTGQKQQQLNDSVIAHNSFSLNDVLNRETTIYFKQNGYGGVSSASFRGTTAQQTAVLWNGININSQLTGQTDFNTLLTSNFKSVNVKYGGGSVLYGTGAIGGSIHLNSGFSTDNDSHHAFQSGYGSFNTYQVSYNFQEQIDQLKFKIGFARRQSDNDYDIPDQNRQNSNGQFNMNSLDAALSYRIDNRNTINYYGNLTFGDRNFSLIRSSDPKSNYENLESRNLLEWQQKRGNIQSNLKAAYLTEEFSFIDNIERDPITESSSQVQTAWFQHELWFRTKNITLNSVINYQNNQARGDNLVNADRNLFGLSMLFKHELSAKFNYEVTLRQDINGDYDNPFLFSFGASYRLFQNINLNWSASKNYRLPTFNDLFWQNGGNPDLVPEESYQTELGLVYNNRNFNFGLTGFYNDISDMIRWLPDETGIWQPENTDEVQAYGIESTLSYNKKVLNDHMLRISAMYSFTISEDGLTDNQLIYIPNSILRLNSTYSIKNWSVGLFYQYTGEVFTRTNNDPNDTINDYMLLDAQVSWNIPYIKNTSLSLNALNLFDLAYEVVENRPMPGRSFSINLITQF